MSESKAKTSHDGQSLSRNRRRFSEEFKRDAVRLVVEEEYTFKAAAKAVGRTKRHQRSRLMRAFNTPFFPDILVCSQVMGEGVDLQRYCCNVLHHDLAWNPSSIEQRIGRIDRLGCKACKPQPEQPIPIHIYLPYLSGAADERQFRVMTDREQWFRIVMGQDEVAKLIPCDDHHDRPPLPTAFSDGLTFQLGLTADNKGKSADL